MTDFAPPKPPLPFALTLGAPAAIASSCKNSGRLRPSIAAPPTRRNSRRLRLSQKRLCLPGMDNMVSVSYRTLSVGQPLSLQDADRILLALIIDEIASNRNLSEGFRSR